ncbi:cutinase family protein [Rhodococcus koreensis]|uniref:NHL repeat-containing protein n=1 Tax=Rhodococcus koreensis TaxID=99653 RepID=A0A1H4I870_9NOCA|nr:cutinase family protein [Rhodococcus koreensis]SEB29472.1 NHL repeat-containing protein [Rhodococcus koreensis]
MPNRTAAASRSSLAVLAVLTLVCGFHMLVGENRAYAADCNDGVVLLGARGSGQGQNEKGGLGPEVSFAYNEIKRKFDRQRIKFRYQAVVFPAAPVKPPELATPPGREVFFGSIEIGVNNAIIQLFQIQNGLRTPSCAGPRIILAGYSQGAMVMHRVIERLRPGGSDANSELLGRVGAALLIADGDKMPGDTDNLYTRGVTATTQGVGAALSLFSHASGVPFASDVRARVFSVCVSRDIVCDWTNPFFTPSNPRFLARQSIGRVIHEASYRGSTHGAVTPLVEKVISGLRSTPPPNEGQVTLPFTGLIQPSFPAVDSLGNVYIADQGRNQVLKLLPSGEQQILPFSGLNVARGIAVDSAGNVYLADSNNARVLKLPAGSTSQVVLPFTGLTSNLFGLTVDSAGSVYVSDVQLGVVKLPAGSSQQVVLPFSDRSTSAGGVAVDGVGNVYLAMDNRVLKLAPGSSTQTVLPFTGLGANYNGLAVDAAGNVFVGDGGTLSNGAGRVVKLANVATTQTDLPFTGLGRSLFGLTVDSTGNLYVADLENARVVKLPRN